MDDDVEMLSVATQTEPETCSVCNYCSCNFKLSKLRRMASNNESSQIVPAQNGSVQPVGPTLRPFCYMYLRLCRLQPKLSQEHAM